MLFFSFLNFILALCFHFFFFFFNDTATTEIYTLSLHDALPIFPGPRRQPRCPGRPDRARERSEEHTSELQSRQYLVCRLLLEKKKTNQQQRLKTKKKIKKQHNKKKKKNN